MKRMEFKGAAMIFIAGVLWGIIGVFAKQMQSYGSTPVLTSFLRVFFSFFIMLAVTASIYGIKVFKIDKKTLLFCALLGLVCHGIYNIFYMLAVMLSGVTVSAVLLDIAPIVTFAISAVFLSEKVTLIKVFAVILNVLGCVLTVASTGIYTAEFSPIGILCGTGAGICYALTAIFGRFAARNTNSFVSNTYSYFFAAIFLFIYMMLNEHEININSEILSWGFFFALIPTSLAYLIYYCGLQRIKESSKVPVIASVETVVAAVLGIFLYNEKMDIVGFTGILFVFLSIILMNKKEIK